MKTALLVGINDYPGSRNDLAGCVNDTANLQRVLVQDFGFDSGGVRVLTDARATRSAVMDGLADMVAKAGAGDLLVFHYSGHGAQVPDQDEDEASDRMDEVLCPRDFSWDGCWIRDDDLSEVFSRLPRAAHLEVILDCCHSGTGTREIALGSRTATVSAGIAAATADRSRTARVRYLAPPPEAAARYRTSPRGSRLVTKVGMLVKAKTRGLNHVLWAACRPDQYSADADIGGSPNGAFTWYFCEAARAVGRTASRADLLERIRKGLRSGGFDQVPQLECIKTAREGRVFAAGPA